MLVENTCFYSNIPLDGVYFESFDEIPILTYSVEKFIDGEDENV